MPRTAPPFLSLVLTILRKSRGWTGRDLETASGVSAKMISLYERGARTLSRERLEALAVAMGFDSAAIDFFLLAVGRSAEAAREPPSSPVDPTPDGRRHIGQLAARLGRDDEGSDRDASDQAGADPPDAAGPAQSGGALGPAQERDARAAVAAGGGRPGVSALVPGGASLPRERGGGFGPGGPRPGAGPAGPSGGGAGARRQMAFAPGGLHAGLSRQRPARRQRYAGSGGDLRPRLEALGGRSRRNRGCSRSGACWIAKHPFAGTGVISPRR